LFFTAIDGGPSIALDPHGVFLDLSSFHWLTLLQFYLVFILPVVQFEEARAMLCYLIQVIKSDISRDFWIARTLAHLITGSYIHAYVCF
jgi:hypothetical protein